MGSLASLFEDTPLTLSLRLDSFYYSIPPFRIVIHNCNNIHFEFDFKLVLNWDDFSFPAFAHR